MLWQQKRTQLPIPKIVFGVENKTKRQRAKDSVTGIFCSNLDLNMYTAGEKPSLFVFVETYQTHGVQIVLT